MHRRTRAAIPAVSLAALLALLLAGCARSGAAAAGGAGTLVVDARTVTGVGAVLVGPTGLTLYHLPSETASKITCTGQCAAAWPPLLLPAGDTTAAGGSGVSGSFGTVTRPDGATQVMFDGMPLYTYTGDTAPGEAKGQNVDAFVAVSATGSGSTPASTGHGGYGGGGY